ncbi:hypothetical protein J3459_008295 [Metarhizium acridum]|uniref:uncharacterized protein n=1 Tax=Metarhizium acridum TaxID=92637 RepID=UPI001C6B5F52|nr:hypothetical protein J3458_000222 [Metarhizium acridum]KAG8426261.1 hypothetical protein J3459_008295 [Metarhizium acridum]
MFNLRCRASFQCAAKLPRLYLHVRRLYGLRSAPPNYAEYFYLRLCGIESMPKLSRLMQKFLENALVTDRLNCNHVVRRDSPITQSKMSNCQILAHVIVPMIRQT